MKPRRTLTTEMRRQLRRASTDAQSKYTIGGNAKRRGGPKPVTLPALDRIAEREKGRKS